MKVLLDTNVILDFLLRREIFFKEAKEIILLVNEQKVQGFLCPTTITTIYYFMRKSFSEDECLARLKQILSFFEVTKVDKDTLLQSIENSSGDFEDSVIYTSAKNIDIIVTRDRSGFKKSTKKVLTPDEFLEYYFR